MSFPKPMRLFSKVLRPRLLNLPDVEGDEAHREYVVGEERELVLFVGGYGRFHVIRLKTTLIGAGSIYGNPQLTILTISGERSLRRGWAFAQFPYLVEPSLSIYNASAPPITLRLMAMALAAGSLLLLPWYWYVLAVFKSQSRRRFAYSSAETKDQPHAIGE